MLCVSEYAADVHGEVLEAMGGIFATFTDVMSQQADRSISDFMANRQSTIDSINAHLEQAKRWTPHFAGAAVLKRSILNDGGIQRTYAQMMEQMRIDAGNIRSEMQQERQRAMDEARKFSADIEEKARRTAAGSSFKNAQDQFEEARKDNKMNVWLWAAITFVSVAAFFGTLVWFYKAPPPVGQDWHVAYHTVLRVAILSGLGAVIGICVKMLRAYLHMREHNLHRRRVANSIEAFVMAGQTSEARDVILAQLVDAVVSYGVSGLLTTESDSLGSHRTLVDAMSRLIRPGKKEAA